ncbi:hypothetical protein APHAL10511_008262 [Amanita phalloides]|nr:hypothetical protein APHAL10511_008262 [Amanita phalloides]
MESPFDAIILGTSLTESILAAALSKAGFKVAHIDVNKWYGGDEASLSLDELVQWAEQARTSHSQRYTHVHVHTTLLPETSQRDSRFYALSLCPSIIPSVGPTIASLVSSGVARYGGYKLVDHISVYDASSTPPSFKSVPCRREDVFKNAEISLVEKRRIMRFLTFAASEEEPPPLLDPNADAEEDLLQFIQTKFSVSGPTAAAIGYALAFCTSPSDHVRPALARLRRYIRSSGRYGPSPFLIGQYGGTGEIAQGFCRAAAVHGAVYILGRKVLSVSGPPEAGAKGEDGGLLYTVVVQDVPEPLKCKLLIASPHMAEYLSSSSSLSRFDPPMLIPNSGYEEAHSVARCIAIVDFPLLPPASQSPPPPPAPPPAGEEDPEGGGQGTPAAAPPALRPQDQEQDTIIYSFPPSSLPFGIGSSTHVFLLRRENRETLAPSWNPISPRPCLSLLLLLHHPPPTPSDTGVLPPDTERSPLFMTFYIEHPYKYAPPPRTSFTSTRRCAYIVTPPVCTDRLPESPDLAAEHAERVFREAVAVLRTHAAEEVPMWPIEAEQNDEEEEDEW